MTDAVRPARTRTSRNPIRNYGLVAAVVALLVAALAPTPTPASADTTGPAIVHVPVATTNHGTPVPITARTTCPTAGVCTARLYYRITMPQALATVPGVVDQPGFTMLDMTAVASTPVDTYQSVIEWTQTIPASATTTTGIDYYLEADQNGTRTVLPGTTTVSTTPASSSYWHIHVVSPPLISHVEPPYAIADTPVDIEVQVTCSTGNCDATLYYRRTPLNSSDPAAAYSSVPMQEGAGQAIGDAAVFASHTAQIPASHVDTTGVDYYIHVTDGATNAYSPGTTYEGHYAPRDGTRASAYHLHVLEPPRLTHVPVAASPYRQDIAITARTNCPSTRSCTGTLYYRTTTTAVTDATVDATFSTTLMIPTRIPGASGVDVVTLDGLVPGSAADTRGVDYFFSVTDGTTTSWWPGTSAVDAPGTWVNGARAAYHHIRILEPPHFAHVPQTVAQALQDLVIEAELTCATASCTADLVWTPTPNVPNSSRTTPMEKVSDRSGSTTTPATRVELRRAVIPAADVTTRGLAYYMTASDSHTNTASPGTSYWGAYVPVDGGTVAPETLRYVVRVVDPPHPVHAPAGVAYTDEPAAIQARSNCATGNCNATLHWRINDQGWKTTPMGQATEVPPLAYGNALLVYNFAIPAADVTEVGLEYRIEVNDGYVTETTPTYPVVVADRPSGTVVVFTPPATQGLPDTDVPLVLAATWSNGDRFNGTVRWCANPVSSTATGCFLSGTTQAQNGNAVFTVRPTSAVPQLRVTAYADGLTTSVQDPTEVDGVATVVAVTPPQAPEVTTVAFAPPAGQAAPETTANLRFTALKGDGTTGFTGTVHWTAGMPGSPSSSGSTFTSTGSGDIPVTPTAATPVVQVIAWADSPTAGTPGSQDTSEVPGSAVAVAAAPPPVTGPGGSAVVFDLPVSRGATGSQQNLGFTAFNADGSKFSGSVHWGSGPAGSVLATTMTVNVGSDGRGSIPVTPTFATPAMQVVAYADVPGSPPLPVDPAEIRGFAAAVGDTPPPPPAPGTEVVVTNPVQRVPAGVGVVVAFRALRYDGSNFVGDVRWGQAAAGGTVEYTGTVTLGPGDNGVGSFIATAGASPILVSAYADRPDAGITNSPDANEVPGTGVVAPM